MENAKIPAGAPWIGAALWPMLGLGAALGYWFMLNKKGHAMTPMEKAFNALLLVLCDKLAKLDAEAEELRKRPTRAEIERLQEQAQELRVQLEDGRAREKDLQDKLRAAELTIAEENNKPRPASRKRSHSDR